MWCWGWRARGAFQRISLVRKVVAASGLGWDAPAPSGLGRAGAGADNADQDLCARALLGLHRAGLLRRRRTSPAAGWWTTCRRVLPAGRARSCARIGQCPACSVGSRPPAGLCRWRCCAFQLRDRHGAGGGRGGSRQGDFAAGEAAGETVFPLGARSWRARPGGPGFGRDRSPGGSVVVAVMRWAGEDRAP